MTATTEIPPTRAEINRRNAQRSTGPKTQAGKERSRFNALKHGCRARLPILPGEDPEAYQDRLDAWIDKFQPRDAVEAYMVERTVHASWQLDRADRAEVAAMVEATDEQALRRARDVLELGATLFRAPHASAAATPTASAAATATTRSRPSPGRSTRNIRGTLPTWSSSWRARRRGAPGCSSGGWRWRRPSTTS